jgi:hypothetical protein
MSNMIKVGTIVALGLAALTFAAEAKVKKKEPAKAAADYFPLQVGYKWTYRNLEEGGYTLSVAGEEPAGAGPVQYVVQLLSGVKVHRVYSKIKDWVLLHSENYLEHEGLKTTYDPPRRYLPNPLLAGQKWEWSGKDPTQVEYRESSKAVGFEDVAVPAGKFRAMKVVTEVTGASILKIRTNWYADGVGLVKSATEAGLIKYGSELIDYSFKKPAQK